MYGSKAACCSARGYFSGAGGLHQPASVSAPDYHASTGIAAAAATIVSPLSNSPAYFCSSSASPSSTSAASSASSPSSLLRPFPSSRSPLVRRPSLWCRKAALDQISSLLFSPLRSIKGNRPRQGLSKFWTRRRKLSTSFPFSEDQHRSRTRLCKVLNADAEPDTDVADDEVPLEEELWTVNEGGNNAAFHADQTQNQKHERKSQLKNRIVFGLGIGAGLLGLVLAGGWVYTLAFSGVIWIGTGEYFELVKSKGNVARGMTPPPPVAAKVCAAFCSLMPIMTLYYGGRMGVVVTTSAFGLATVLLLQEGPRFSQLTSAIFGLIYCGYLPSFWIKLRCGLNVPALNTRLAAGWPVLFGGQAHWTVGLVATIVSCSAIAAADTFSFLGGKTLGRTPLIAVSPKKTIEGAAVGLSCTITTTVLLSKLLQWPASTPSAALLAILIFMSSLFGDLTESVMKRDAGVKDSGQLIPGHGGILDRVDSYVFTGALVYSFVKIGVPLFGV